MQYSPRRLLSVLGLPIALGLAACSSYTATPTPTPTPAVDCRQLSSYRDIMTPGQGYEFFKGQKTSSPIRHIQYKGGNSFAFLDDNMNVVMPEEARPYANPDGSVKFRKGGKFEFLGRIYGTGKIFNTKITFMDFGDNMAVIDVVMSECEPNGSQKDEERRSDKVNRG